ncbi:hypothetical protein CYMTET_4657, partial [Cymbomonas tetramitiformis]
IANRAARLGVTGDDIYLYSATRMQDILEAIARTQPALVIIDSIQTVYLEDVSSSAGSVTQVRECATAFLHAAKRSGVPIVMVGHVTKQGDIAGPRVLEHIVDVVLYLEGEGMQGHRILRGIKNRYGPTDEVAVLEMVGAGLAPVQNPSAAFLTPQVKGEAAVSAAVTVSMEGSRPLLLEVQALCSEATQAPGGGKGGGVRRYGTGVQLTRLHLLLAVLTKRMRLPLYRQDVFVNVTGGIQLTEPATDLAVVAAVVSSFFDVPIGPNLVFLGEVGLGGELRSVPQIERRLTEAAKLGFKRAVVPAGCTAERKGLDIVRCSTVSDAMQVIVPDLLERST